MPSLEPLPRPTKIYHATTYDRIAKHNCFDGKGKTILITGGASGIGYSFSKAFTEAGVARTAIVSRSPGSQEKAKTDLEAAFPSIQILPFQASVTDNNRITEVLQKLGTIDVLVLNAAVAHRCAQATEISTEEMQDAFDTNVIATFNIAKAYLAMPLPAAGRNTILNASAAAVHLQSSSRVGYDLAKSLGRK